MLFSRLPFIIGKMYPSCKTIFRGDIGYQVVTPYYEASKMYTHAQAVRVVIASIRNSFVSQLRKGLVKTLVHNLIGKLII